MDKIRIIIAEDHETIREGLRMLIDAQADFEVVGEAADGSAAVKLAKKLKPDVLIMDVSMPELNGLKAMIKIKEILPEIKILTLTRHKSDAYLQALLRAGSSGYVLKQSSSAELIRAVRAVAAGDKYLDPSITENVIGRYTSRSQSPGIASKETLTDRETEVIRLIAWGYSNKEIAARLQISVKTVEAHKANSMRKLDMKSRIDIVRYAILQNWLIDN